jgi:hypothetical protein
MSQAAAVTAARGDLGTVNRSPYFVAARRANPPLPPGQPSMCCGTPLAHGGKPVPKTEPMLASSGFAESVGSSQ